MGVEFIGSIVTETQMAPQETTSAAKVSMDSKDIMSRLRRGEVILGDGSYVVTLEKRGYVKAGDWTPEASVEEPEGVKMLATEFAKAGADPQIVCTSALK